MSLSFDTTFVSLDIIIVTRLAPVQTGLAEIPICSHSLQFYGKYEADQPLFVWSCLVKLPPVNQRGSEFICKVSPCSPSTKASEIVSNKNVVQFT